MTNPMEKKNMDPKLARILAEHPVPAIDAANDPVVEKTEIPVIKITKRMRREAALRDLGTPKDSK